MKITVKGRARGNPKSSPLQLIYKDLETDKIMSHKELEDLKLKHVIKVGRRLEHGKSCIFIYGLLRLYNHQLNL